MSERWHREDDGVIVVEKDDSEDKDDCSGRNGRGRNQGRTNSVSIPAGSGITVEGSTAAVEGVCVTLAMTTNTEYVCGGWDIS